MKLYVNYSPITDLEAAAITLHNEKIQEPQSGQMKSILEWRENTAFPQMGLPSGISSWNEGEGLDWVRLWTGQTMRPLTRFSYVKQHGCEGS